MPQSSQGRRQQRLRCCCCSRLWLLLCLLLRTSATGGRLAGCCMAAAGGSGCGASKCDCQGSVCCPASNLQSPNIQHRHAYTAARLAGAGLRRRQQQCCKRICCSRRVRPQAHLGGAATVAAASTATAAATVARDGVDQDEHGAESAAGKGVRSVQQALPLPAAVQAAAATAACLLSSVYPLGLQICHGSRVQHTSQRAQHAVPVPTAAAGSSRPSRWKLEGQPHCGLGYTV